MFLSVPFSIGNGSGSIPEVKAKAAAEVVCVLNWQRAFAHPLALDGRLQSGG